LRWQEQNDSPQDIVHQGNEAAITQYICDNRAELENTLRRLQQEEAFERAHTSEFPITFDEWMQYLDKNDCQFRNLMVEANKQRRRLSERISSGEDMSATLRVYPVPSPERGHSPEWSHLGAGLFGFGLKGEMSRITVFSAYIGNIVYACRLYATLDPLVFELLSTNRFAQDFKPIAIVLREAQLFDKDLVEVVSLDWDVIEARQTRVVFSIIGASPVYRSSASRNARQSDLNCSNKITLQEDDCDGVEDSLNNGGMDARHSDCESVFSMEDCPSSDDCDEDFEEQEPHCVGDDLAHEAPVAARAERGSCIVHSNIYFSFSDNPQYPDVKVNLKSVWCTEDHLGRSPEMSKALTPSHYGEPRDNPRRSMWCLRAWALWRFTHSVKPDWIEQRSARVMWFHNEIKSLRSEIVDASSDTQPTTGNHTADNRIREWCPRILRPRSALA